MVIIHAMQTCEGRPMMSLSGYSFQVCRSQAGIKMRKLTRSKTHGTPNSKGGFFFNDNGVYACGS